MTVVNVTNGPPLPQAAVGDTDLDFLEKQATKIIDRTLNLTIVFTLVATIAFSAVGIGFIVAGILDPFGRLVLWGLGGFMLVFGPVLLPFALPGSRFTIDHRIRNMWNWKKYLTSRSTAVLENEPRGKLECLMRMVASMEGWLETARDAEVNAVTRTLIGVTMGSLVATNIPHASWVFFINITILLTAMALALCGYAYIYMRHSKRLAFWRPRLGAFLYRLNGYWGSL